MKTTIVSTGERDKFIQNIYFFGTKHLYGPIIVEHYMFNNGLVNLLGTKEKNVTYISKEGVG